MQSAKRKDGPTKVKDCGGAHCLQRPGSGVPGVPGEEGKLNLRRPSSGEQKGSLSQVYSLDPGSLTHAPALD